MTTYCSLLSGSSGNCQYLSNGDTSLLIDAGGTLKAIQAGLVSVGSALKDIDAVLLTHEHSDHIKSLLPVIRRSGAAIYMSAGTAHGLKAAGIDVPSDLLHIFEPGGEFCIGSLCIRPFETSHDASQSVGYRIDTSDDKGIAIATDLGCVKDSVVDAMRGADLAVVETNHDIQMLMTGPYPYFLKRRINSERGHLSNEKGAQLALELAVSGTRKFVLAHLSAQNNLAQLAMAEVRYLFDSKGIDKEVSIEVAPRLSHGVLHIV